jgi:predicted transport protein
MKKLILALSIFILTKFYSYGQATYVVENGITFTRIQTLSELQSLGGITTNNTIESGRKKYSGSYIACKKGNGCCLTNIVVSTNNNDEIININLPIQTLDDSTKIEAELTNVLAYYNSELEVIIYRSY